jgi:hypothetical protein
MTEAWPDPVGWQAQGPVPARRSAGPILAGLAILVLFLAAGIVASRSQFRSVRSKPGYSAASVGIPPGDKLPVLDRNGDPVVVDVPISVPSASPARLPGVLMAVSASGPVVTPAAATVILTATWQLRAAALAKSDAHLFATFETGAALEEDLGRCTCEGGNPFGTIHSTSVLVPRQMVWPAEFLGEVASTGAGGVPWGAYLVFRRTGPSEPWKVVLAGGFQPATPPARLDQPLMDADGYALSPGPIAGQRDLPRQLATYWQAWKDTRRAPPTIFTSGVSTDGEGALLAKYGQGQVNDANGLVGHYVYSADPVPGSVHSFAAVGYDVTCGVVRNQRTWTPSPGYVIKQDSGRHNWGPTVAPGTYRAMIQTEISEPCFFFRPSGPVDVRGADEYPATFVAVP